MCLQDVVSAPLDLVEQVVGLAAGAVAARISDTSPGQHRHGIGEGETKLDEIPGCKKPPLFYCFPFVTLQIVL